MPIPPSVYAIGSKVLVVDFTHKKRKEGKLDFRWIGPYYIRKNLGKGYYLLQEESTLKEPMVLTSNHTLLVVLKKKSQSQLPEKELQTLYLSICTTNLLGCSIERTVPFL